MSAFGGNNGGENIEELRAEVEALNKILDKLKTDTTFSTFANKFDAPREAARRLTEVFKDLEANIKKVNDEVGKIGLNSASTNMKIVSDAAEQLVREVHAVTDSFEKMNKEFNKTTETANNQGVKLLTNQLQGMSDTMERITSIYTAFQTALSATTAPQGFAQMIQQQEMMKQTTESLINTMERIKTVASSYKDIFNEGLTLEFKGIDQQEIQATIDALNILANSINQVSRVSSVAHIVDEMRDLVNVGRESNAIGQSIMFDTLKGELHTFGDSLSKASDKIRDAYTTMQLLKSFDGGLDKTFFGDIQAITVAGDQIDQYRGKLEGLFEQIRKGKQINSDELKVNLASLMAASKEAVQSINSVSESANNMSLPANKIEQFTNAMGLFKDQKERVSDVMNVIKQYETLIVGTFGPEKWSEISSGFRQLSGEIESELTKSAGHFERFQDSILSRIQNGNFDIGTALTKTIVRGFTEWKFGNESDTIIGGVADNVSLLRDNITAEKRGQYQRQLNESILSRNDYISEFSNDLVTEHKMRFQPGVPTDRRGIFLNAAIGGQKSDASKEVIERIFNARFRMDDIINELQQQNLAADRAQQLIDEYSLKEAELIDGLTNNNKILKRAGRSRVSTISPRKGGPNSSPVISTKKQTLGTLNEQIEQERRNLEKARQGDIDDPLLKELFDHVSGTEDRLDVIKLFTSMVQGTDETADSEIMKENSEMAKRHVNELRKAAKKALEITKQIEDRTPDLKQTDIKQLKEILGMGKHLSAAYDKLSPYSDYEANRQASPKVAKEIEEFAKQSMQTLADSFGENFEHQTDIIISNISQGDFQKESLLTPIRDEISTVLNEVNQLFDNNISKHKGTADELANSVGGITSRLEEQKNKIEQSIIDLNTDPGSRPFIEKLKEVLGSINTAIENNNKFAKKVSETDKEDYIHGLLNNVESQMALESNAVKSLGTLKDNLESSIGKTSGSDKAALEDAYKQISDILEINENLQEGLRTEFGSNSERAEFLHNKMAELIAAIANLRDSSSMSKLEEIAAKPVQDIIATTKKIFTMLSVAADDIQASADKAMNEVEYGLRGASTRLKAAEGNMSLIGRSGFENSARNLLDDVALSTIGADTRAQRRMAKVLGSEGLNFDSLSEYLDKSVTSFSIVKDATEKLRKKMEEARNGSDVLKGIATEDGVEIDEMTGQVKKNYKYMIHKDGEMGENRGKKEIVDDLIEATSHLQEMAKTSVQLARMFSVPKDELDKVPADVKKAFEHSRRMLTDNASQIDSTLRAIIEAGLQDDPRLKPHIDALVKYRETMADITREAEQAGDSLKKNFLDGLKSLGRGLGLQQITFAELFRKGMETIREFERSSTDITRVVANDQLGGIYGNFGGNFSKNMPFNAQGNYEGSNVLGVFEGTSNFIQQYRNGLSDMENRIAKRLGMQGEGYFYSGTDVAKLNAQFMRETAGVQNIRTHRNTVKIDNLLGDEGNIRGGGQTFGVGESMARFAAISGMEAPEAMNIFVKLYKELGQSIDGAEYSMYKMAQTARATGTPISEHIKNVMELTDSYKKWGDVSGVADALMGQFREMGFSSLQSKELTNNIFSSAANMGLGQATYFQQFQRGVSNPFTAMRNAFDIYDENGKIREDKLFERIGDTMDFIDKTVNFGNDPDEIFMNRALVLQKQFGYDNATASVIARNPENRDKVREAIERFDRTSNPTKAAEAQLEELTQIKKGVSDILKSMGDAQPWEQVRKTIDEQMKSVGEQFINPFSNAVRDLTKTVQQLIGAIDKFVGYISNPIRQAGRDIQGHGLLSDVAGGLLEAGGDVLGNLGTIPGVLLTYGAGKKLLTGARRMGSKILGSEGSSSASRTVAESEGWLSRLWGKIKSPFGKSASRTEARVGSVVEREVAENSGLLAKAAGWLERNPKTALLGAAVLAAGGTYAYMSGKKSGSGSAIEEGIEDATSVVSEIRITNAILNSILSVLMGGKIDITPNGAIVTSSTSSTLMNMPVGGTSSVTGTSNITNPNQMPTIAIPMESEQLDAAVEETMSNPSYSGPGIGNALATAGVYYVGGKYVAKQLATKKAAQEALEQSGKAFSGDVLNRVGMKTLSGAEKSALEKTIISSGTKAAAAEVALPIVGEIAFQGYDLYSRSKEHKLSTADWLRSITQGAFGAAGGIAGTAFGGPIGGVIGGVGGSMLGDQIGKWMFGKTTEELEEEKKRKQQELIDMNKDQFVEMKNWNNDQKTNYQIQLDKMEHASQISEAQRDILKQLSEQGIVIKNLGDLKINPDKQPNTSILDPINPSNIPFDQVVQNRINWVYNEAKGSGSLQGSDYYGAHSGNDLTRHFKTLESDRKQYRDLLAAGAINDPGDINDKLLKDITEAFLNKAKNSETFSRGLPWLVNKQDGSKDQVAGIQKMLNDWWKQSGGDENLVKLAASIYMQEGTGWFNMMNLDSGEFYGKGLTGPDLISSGEKGYGKAWDERSSEFKDFLATMQSKANQWSNRQGMDPYKGDNFLGFINSLGLMYAPLNDKNDLTDVNKFWGSNVNSMMKSFGYNEETLNMLPLYFNMPAWDTNFKIHDNKGYLTEQAELSEKQRQLLAGTIKPANEDEKRWLEYTQYGQARLAELNNPKPTNEGTSTGSSGTKSSIKYDEKALAEMRAAQATLEKLNVNKYESNRSQYLLNYKKPEHYATDSLPDIERPYLPSYLPDGHLNDMYQKPQLPPAKTATPDDVKNVTIPEIKFQTTIQIPNVNMENPADVEKMKTAIDQAILSASRQLRQELQEKIKEAIWQRGY